MKTALSNFTATRIFALVLLFYPHGGYVGSWYSENIF